MAELAGGSKQSVAMTLGVFDVLNAATMPQNFPQRRLAFHIRLAA